MRRGLYMGIALIALSACQLGPEWEALESVFSQKEAPQTYVNDSEIDETAEPMARWWERLDDPLLDTYIEALLSDNLSLKQAAERIAQARERAAVQYGGLFPTIGSSNTASRQFTPVDGIAAFPGQGSDRIYFSNIRGGLDVGWQLDLFGRVRSATESAEAQFEAAQFDFEALQQSLIAELLQRRVAVAINSRLLTLAQDTATSQENVYELTERRYRYGASAITAADVFLTEESYRTALADVSLSDRQLAEQLYQLDVLLGKVPGSTDPLRTEFMLVPPPRDVPVCLPVELLDRRPDIKAAELRAVSANADIGVAVADLYPDFSVSASLGVAGNQFQNILSRDQLAGSLLGSITARFFEGGALRANIRLQEAELRELAAAYAETVLNALREVETALQAEKALVSELESKERSTESLRKAEAISQKRYERGVLSLQDYLQTQQRLYAMEQSLLRTQQEVWNNRIALYLALGGDWLNEETTEDACVRHAKAVEETNHNEGAAPEEDVEREMPEPLIELEEMQDERV